MQEQDARIHASAFLRAVRRGDSGGIGSIYDLSLKIRLSEGAENFRPDLFVLCHSFSLVAIGSKNATLTAR